MPKMKVIKSIYIDSAPEKIYPILNDLNNCEQWSPWVIAEPRAHLNVASDGKFHEWDGDIIGLREEGGKCDLLPNDSKLRSCTEELQIQLPANIRRVKS